MQFRPTRNHVVGFVLLILVIQRVGFEILGASHAGTEFVDALNLSANLLAIGCCLAASRRGHGVMRIFWLLFCSAFTLQFSANAGWAYCHAFHITPHASALFPSLFYRLYAGPMAIALFLSDDAHRSRLEAFLDGCIVVGLVGLTMYQLQMAEMNAQDEKIWRFITVSATINFILLAAAVVRWAFSSAGNLRTLFARQTVFLATYFAISCVTSLGDAYLPKVDAAIDLFWILTYLTGAALAITWRPVEVEDEPAKARISRRTSLLCFNLTLATMVLASAILGLRVVDSTRIIGLIAMSVVLFSYAIRCSLMQDNQEKYLAALQESRVQLQHQALYDALTGLPNRRLFGERLSQTLALAQRERHNVALLYLDLDGFKMVNDRLGHAIGDLLLRDVAIRMLSRVRKSDTLARMGGDEFTLILSHITSREQAWDVAKELLHSLAEPFEIEGHSIAITASVGVGVFPESATDAEQLVQQADSAMYGVKHSRKNDVSFFSPAVEACGLEPQAV